MRVTPSQDALFRKRLPIDAREKILAVYRHHPIVYVIPLILAFLMISVIAGLAFALTSNGADGISATIDPYYRPHIITAVGVFSMLILAASYVPIWVKSRDHLILTNESVIQILQTSLFSDKVSQLSLQHVTDVTVRAGFWGNLLGYGSLTIETPGEQVNYLYGFLPNANEAAREISEAHEIFIFALESGKLHANKPTVAIDQAEYEKFREYQQKQQPQPPSPEPSDIPQS